MAKETEVFDEDLYEDDVELDRGDEFDSDEDEDEEDAEGDEGREDEDDEGEADEDGSEESDDEVGDDEDEGRVKKNIRIPKHRLDQEIAKRKAAAENFERERARSAWLEEQLTKLLEKGTKTEEPLLPPYDFDAAEEKFNDLLLEGNVKEAAALRKEIREKEREYFKELANSIREEAVQKATNEIAESKFNVLVENFESKYPFLNASSKDFNKEAVDTVNTFMAGYMAQGKSKAEALKIAVSKVAPLYEAEKPKGKDRTIEARKKNVDASRKQPPNNRISRSAGRDVNALDVSKLTEKQLKELTPREIAKLRGDIV
jgi:hypothetical protein